MRESSSTRAPSVRQRRVRRLDDLRQAVRFCAGCAPRVNLLRGELEMRVVLGAVAFCADCRGSVVRWLRLDRYEAERRRKREQAGIPVDAPVKQYRCSLCNSDEHNARRCPLSRDLVLL